jgi:hypothetical protein
MHHLMNALLLIWTALTVNAYNQIPLHPKTETEPRQVAIIGKQH